MKINSIYLQNILPSDIQFMMEYYEFSKEDAEYYCNRRVDSMYSKAVSNRRWKKFLDSLVKGEYYFFITVPILDEYWHKVSKEEGFEEKLVWTSKAPAHNGGYPEKDPELRAYLYRW